MAKQALLGVLEKTIGKYVLDLDAEKLNVGIWSGKVELHDLQLDVKACNGELDRQAAEAPNLAVPLKVVGGSFQSLLLEIPWSQLTTKSVVMKAQGLHIHVAPHDRLQETDFMKLAVGSENKRARHIQEQREQFIALSNETRLQTHELMKLAQLSEDEDENDDSTTDTGFVARLVKRIVENLEVEIQDVQVTVKGKEGTAGMVLQNLSFVTTDMAGHRTFVDRTVSLNPSDLLNKFLYKKLQIQGFGLFVEPTRENGTSAHNYILDPLNFEATLREADASITKDYAKWLLKSKMPAVQLGLSQTQYQQAAGLVAAMAPSSNAARPLFPELRPLHRVNKQSAQDWWQYAYKCVGRLTGRRSWMTFFEAFKARKTYVALYRRKTHAETAKWLKPLTIEEEADLNEIEADRSISVEGIMIWRTFADAQVEKERAKRKAQEPNEPKRKSGILSNLFGRKSSDSKDDNETPITLSAEELKELEDVGREKIDNTNELSADSKLCRVEFVLGEFRIHLTNAADQPMMELEMGRVSSSFDSDKGGSFQFGFSLQSLEVLDHLHSSSLFPRIVRSLQGPAGSTKPPMPANEGVFQVHMSKSKKRDKKLTVKLIPFEAVCAPHLMTELMGFVTLPQPENGNAESTPHIEEIDEDEDNDNDIVAKTDRKEVFNNSEYTESISNALVEAWQEKTKEKTTLSIDLNLQAPILVLPENCTDPKASVIVLDLGGFRFQYGFSEGSPKVTKWLEENPRDIPSPGSGTVVDNGRLELENMTFLVGEAETWRRITSMPENNVVEQEAIIEPITVHFDIGVESVVSSNIPRACVFTTITESNFKVSPNHLAMALRVYNAWMFSLEKMRGGSGCTQAPTPNNNPSLEENKGDSTVSTTKKRVSTVASTSDGHSTATDQELALVAIDEVRKTVENAFTHDTPLFTTMFLDIATEKYSCVIYDSGEFQQIDGLNAKKSSPVGSIAEGLALEGGMQLSVSLAADKSGDISSTSVEIQGKDFQMFSGFGRELKRSLQILEPVTGTLKVRLQNKGQTARKTDVKVSCNDDIDLTVSMRNLSLIKAISTELSECIQEGFKRQNDNGAETMEGLDEETTKEIEAMSSVLESEDSKVNLPKQTDETGDDAPRESANTGGASASTIAINLKVPVSKLVIINDLQGLDEALFRIETNEFISKGTMTSNLSQTVFDIKLHAKMLADYFDPSLSSWRPLLKRPFELESQSRRTGDNVPTSGRYNTRVDIHFFPLHLSFSEHFLIGLGSVQKMWAELEQESKSKYKAKSSSSGFNPRASATRNLVKALPYALDNFSGIDVEYLLPDSRVGNHSCPNGTTQYFRFNPPKGKGCGGKRLYGEDVVQDLSIQLFIGDETIEIERIDDDLGKPKRCHILKDGTMLVTTVCKQGLSTILRLSSNLYMRNRTSVPAKIAIVHNSKEIDVGVCEPTSSLLDTSESKLVPYNVKDGTLSKKSLRIGLRHDKMSSLAEEWAATGKGQVTMKISPQLDGITSDFHGMLELEADMSDISAAENNTLHLRKDVVCTSSDPDDHDFVLQAAAKLQLIQGKRLVTYVSLEPRAMLVSTIPVQLTVLTRLPHCFSAHSLGNPEKKDTIHTIHELEPGSKIEVYSAGQALAIKVWLADLPCDGTPTGTSRQWVQIPLSSQLEKPILCLLPFVALEDKRVSSACPGSEFFIAEASPALPDFFLERINDDGKLNKPALTMKNSNPRSKTLLLTVGNYGVDHTGTILFEQMVSKSKGFFSSSRMEEPTPFGTFANEPSKHRLSLLPTSEIPIRLARPVPSGLCRTAVFRVEEVSMSKGGAQATPLLWEDNTPSGYFAYRKLVSSFQSELHIIPEFLVFNGSKKHQVVVKQAGGSDVTIPAGAAVPIFTVDHQKGLPLSFHYQSIGGATMPRRLEELGLHLDLVQTAEGVSLGSLATQTAIGSGDSRLLIKLGEVGEIEREPDLSPDGLLPTSIVNDTLRFRIQADEFAVTLNQAISTSADDDDGQGTLEKAGSKDPSEDERMEKSARKPTGTPASGIPKETSISRRTERPICTIMMKTLIYDVQRLFKAEEDLADGNDIPERCQLSLIIHNFLVRDETPRSPFPIVFDYQGGNRFFDSCVRTKGPLYGRHVKVDLFDLILAHSGKGDEQSKDKMFLQTSENFVWKLIDTADLISQASKGPSDQGDFDKALRAFVPAYSKQEAIIYTPPQVSTIYDMALARVSPFNITVSFRRNPDSSRYERFINNESAHLMRYFTQQLKFTIDKCDLRFARYEEQHLKGPRDRLIEILTAVYVSRMKLKVVTILAAASFRDWKELAARDNGDDEFVDGDLLRVTGSVAGNSVAFAFNKVGRDLGSSVTMGFGAVGQGVENGAAAIGAEGFGRGVNQVIAGVGGGIGGALHGVGEGAGSLFKGAGEGLGHFFGGISGGGSRIAKGVGTSITTGDGGALATGFKEGLSHMGSGLKGSAKAVGTGVGGSVKHVFTAPVAGVKSSVNQASVRGSKKHASDLAQLREEFKDQDYL